MATKLVTCEHCGGKRNCTHSGGRSCRACLEAAGLGRKGFATVRCSYCGGRGKLWVEEEPPAETVEVAEEKTSEGAETEKEKAQ